MTGNYSAEIKSCGSVGNTKNAIKYLRAAGAVLKRKVYTILQIILVKGEVRTVV